MLLDGKMLEAFGATLLHSDGGDKNHVWYRRWIKVAHLKRQHYDLPGGATGREFVSQLSEEVSRLARGECGSERLVVYLAVMMQRNALVRKAADICHLLKRRLDAWRSSQVDELLPKPHHGKGGGEHTVRVFTRLVLRGQVQSAVRWMTERATNGGI